MANPGVKEAVIKAAVTTAVKPPKETPEIPITQAAAAQAAVEAEKGAAKVAKAEETEAEAKTTEAEAETEAAEAKTKERPSESKLKSFFAGVASGTLAAGRGALAAGRGTTAIAGKISEQGQNIFFFIALMIHFWDALGNFAFSPERYGAYFFLIFLGWFTAFRPQEISPFSFDGFKIFIFRAAPWAIAAFWWAPLWNLVFEYVNMPFTAKNILLVFFSLAAVHFILYKPLPAFDKKPLVWVKYLFWGLLTFYCGMYIFSATVLDIEGYAPGTVDVEVKTALYDLWDLSVKFVKELVIMFYEIIIDFIERISQAGVTSYERQLAIGMGPYYQGRIDEKAEKKTGVKLEKLEKIGEPFFTHSPVVVQSVMDALTTEDSPIQITFACRAKKDKKIIDADDISPVMFPRVLEVVDRRVETVLCRFDPGTLAAGSYDIELETRFSFRTDTDFSTYMITQERLTALRREGKEFFKDLGVSRIAHGGKGLPFRSSPGPIKVEVAWGDQPKVIDLNVDRTYPMSIKIIRLWQGKIIQINRLLLLTPKGMSVTAAYGAGLPEGTQETFTQITCEEAGEAQFGCDDELLNVFEINPGPPKEIKEKTKIYSVELVIDDPIRLLGAGIFALKSFGIITDYDFAHSKKTKVKVIELEQ